MYQQSEKNLLSSNISSRCPYNMVNFGLLAAEILSLVWGTPGNFNGFRVLAALLHRTLVVGVSQTAAFNRGRHLYSAGRPSGWALAHISSFLSLTVEALQGKRCQDSLLSGGRRSVWANISGGRGHPWGIFFGFAIRQCKLHRATCRRFHTIPACDRRTDVRNCRS